MLSVHRRCQHGVIYKLSSRCIYTLISQIDWKATEKENIQFIKQHLIIIYEIIWSFYAPHPFDDNCLKSITTKYLNLDILSNILFVSVFLLMKCILTFNFYVIRFKSIWHRALSIVYLTFASVDFLFDSANKR